MSLPDPLSVGDIVGLHFPTAKATWAHPGIIMQILDPGPERDAILQRRGIADQPNKALCLLLMVSHGEPPKGEVSEFMPAKHRVGTYLDQTDSLYVCYRHYDLAFLPGVHRRIASVGSPYLGQLPEDIRKHYWSQFMAVQAYERNKSFKKPEGVIFA